MDKIGLYWERFYPLIAGIAVFVLLCAIPSQTFLSIYQNYGLYVVVITLIMMITAMQFLVVSVIMAGLYGNSSDFIVKIRKTQSYTTFIGYCGFSLGSSVATTILCLFLFLEPMQRIGGLYFLFFMIALVAHNAMAIIRPYRIFNTIIHVKSKVVHGA